MKKVGSYTSLIDQLKQLEYHLDHMIDIIETYSSALLHLNVREIERITDEYHKASLKYSSLQKDLAQVLANLRNELYLQAGNNGMESNKSIVNGLDAAQQLQLSVIIPSLKQLSLEHESEELSTWRSALAQKAEKMDKKHEKLINLLLFASSCNNQWLRDMYSLADHEYKHYTATGKESKSQVGIGINEQI